MIEYIIANLWLLWTIIALVCLVLELSSGDFYVPASPLALQCQQ